MARPLFGKKQAGEESWISVSDLMAGLMMVFLFILILYAQNADQRLEKAKSIVVEWRNSERLIYDALVEEFEEDLLRWDAIIEKETLTVRFRSPDILFDPGKATLKPEFRVILDDFMPRYIDLIVSRFIDKVDEVRIEGHTSSDWNAQTGELKAFTENMKLSQDRTRAVLEYSLSIQDLEYLTPWIFKNVSANGLSSARLIYNKDGSENKVLSKRVDFKIRTKSKEALFGVIEKIAPDFDRSFQ